MSIDKVVSIGEKAYFIGVALFLVSVLDLMFGFLSSIVSIFLLFTVCILLVVGVFLQKSS